MADLEKQRPAGRVETTEDVAGTDKVGIFKLLHSTAEVIERLFVGSRARLPDFRFAEDHIKLSFLLLARKLTVETICNQIAGDGSITDIDVGHVLRLRTLERAHPSPPGSASALYVLINAVPEEVEAASLNLKATGISLENLRDLSRSLCLMDNAFYEWRGSKEHEDGGNPFHFTLGDDTFGPMAGLPGRVFDLKKPDEPLAELFSGFNDVSEFIQEVVRTR